MAVTFISPTGLAAGEPLLLTATTSAAPQTIHTADATKNDILELYAGTNDGAAYTLYLQIGSGAWVQHYIEGVGETRVFAGQISGSKTIKAYASVASKVELSPGKCIRVG